jgi:transcriptional regulator with XRE-family HTH domain
MDACQFDTLIAGLEEMGFSRSEIAYGAGVSRATVWRLASGEIQSPNYATAVKLQKYAENPVRVSPVKQKFC